MKTKKMVQLSLFTTMALTVFIIESYFPAIVPIPGVKLGLANIITLMVLLLWGWKEAAMVFFLRIILGSMLAGTAVTLIYSLGGGILCLITMIIAKQIWKHHMIWLLSVIGAICHNIGQISVACVVMGTTSVLFYLPILMVSGIITGSFTGLVVQFLITRNPHIKKLFQEEIK